MEHQVSKPERDPHSESKSKPVAEIKDHRVKKGITYYKVLYEHAKSDRGHWVVADELTCTDLIHRYEKLRKKNSPGTSAADREIAEILGIVQDHPGPVYAVIFKDSLKPQVVTRSYLHKHFPDFLLAWYEANLEFIATPEGAEPLRLKKVRAPRQKKTDPAKDLEQLAIREVTET